jgi:hypothetical protein
MYVAVPLLLALVLVVIFAGDAMTEAVLDFGSNPPWQEQPTRITENLTPFADIPGFSAPTPVPTRAP